jgi:hypothetical protein
MWTGDRAHSGIGVDRSIQARPHRNVDLPSADAFRVRSNEDHDFVIHQSRISEQADRVGEVGFARVKVHDISARVRIKQDSAPTEVMGVNLRFHLTNRVQLRRSADGSEVQNLDFQTTLLSK